MSCTAFYFAVGGDACAKVVSKHGTFTAQDFLCWNPAVGDDCNDLWADAYNCIGVSGTPTTRPATSTTKPATTGNGVSTPLPTQPGMVTNCNKFRYIAKSIVFSQVISFQTITRDDFVRWNPTVRSDCSGMQPEVNVCVGVIGGSTTTTLPTTTTTKPTTTTTAGKGIQTPQPTQPDMVANCKKFHFAAKGVVCSQLTSRNKITLADFVEWNPGVGSDCRSM